jgi:DNA-binding SARP family transcriptional activator/tetratricopeptide (TPR) repeat protein
MEPPHHLRCLGPPALLAPNGEPIRFRTKKHLALLVYLAVESRRAHRRDRLASLLWPRVEIAEARHSLATALSILRPRLGLETLETSRDHVTVHPERISLDLDRLLARDILGTEATGLLDVASFLDGFDIPDAPEFAMWKDRQQARLLPTIKDALVVLIDRCRRTGDSRQIEQLADRMLALDELSEEAIRAKMEARALAGDRLTALKVFEEWRVKLEQELHATPSELLEGMAVRLRRRGWDRTTLVDIPSVPTDQWKGRSFVGRTDEYLTLYEAWEHTRKGSPAHILLLGDSGIGKTTLVERLTTAAGLEGAGVSRVQCYDAERDIPYSMLSILVEGLLDRPGASATSPESLAELSRTLPSIRRRFPTIPLPTNDTGETVRIRLAESFHQMLQAIAEEQPVILVVDDLHVSDDASLAVLHLLLRRARREPIMVIMIARLGELHRSPQAARLRDNGRALGLKELELLPLTHEQSREMLRGLMVDEGNQPNASARRALLKAAAGYPMVLELLVQDWQVSGDQSLALAVDAMTADLVGKDDPPAIYREALERLVRSIDPGTHAVLNIASILGRRLNEISLYSIADLRVGQTMAGMAKLVARRVLRDGGEALEFVNELVRTAAYLGIPSPLRRVLHSNIADTLFRLEGHDEEELGLEIAWHCMRAGRSAEATPHLMRGARHAIRSGAPQEAGRALATALPSLAGEPLAEATLLLAEALQEEGRHAESLELLSSVSDTLDGDRRVRATALAALASRNVGVSPESVTEMLAELASISRSCSEPSTQALVGRAMAFLLLESRDPVMVRNVLDLLDSIPADQIGPDTMAEVALARVTLLYQSGDSQRSFDQAALAVEELKRRGAANLVMVQLQSGLGSLESATGEYEAALATYEQALAMANRLGNDSQCARISGNMALCYGRLGRYADQLAWAAKAELTPMADFAGFSEIQWAYNQAFAHAMMGSTNLALATIKSLDARLTGPIGGWVLQAWALWRADLLLLCKQRCEAVASARSGLIDNSFELRAHTFAGPYARWLALATNSRHETAIATEKLNRMANALANYDALDQVEILCAISRVKGLPPWSDVRLQLEEKLNRLPPAVRVQLKMLDQFLPALPC